MSKLAPVSWKELIRRLRALGFDGPHYRGKHPYMIKGGLTLTIPNPHKADISADLLTRILRQAEVTRSDWDRVAG